MKASYLIYGTGGHAAVVADLIQICGGSVEAFFDDQPRNNNTSASITAYDANTHSNAQLIISIGSNAIREKLTEKVKHTFGTLIHPSASVASDVELGEGTVILANAVVQAKAKIGKHVIINAGVCIDHDAVIHDFVHVYSNSYIGGGAVLEKGVLVNPGSVILRGAVVKAGTEIPPLSVVSAK